MADDLSKTISKHNAGFPEYLDFPKLRSAAIEYLGKLSGKIWTDHNVHDPGITILEMLIYAIMDLGYRTSLPVADLFARDPSDKSPDNNFFNASQILANNPLTITDLRKLLVDIEGVKNAWLEIDDSIPVDFCKDETEPGYDDDVILYRAGQDDDFCSCQSLNGLYHVYVQLEKDIDQNKHRYEKVIRKIRKELMAHRNLCEDYLDVNILCELKLGVCADIELETDADEEEVFLEILERVQEYFSPAPHFYTFQQLIEKGRTVEEIFAGRPFNLSESHGFVDTEEFEKLELRKALNLSDLYQVIFSVKGVLGVRNVGWIKCCDEKHAPGKADRSWQINLPENHIPEFSFPCSGFSFTKNGMVLNLDTQKVQGSFELNRSISYRSMYKMPSAFLGPEFPKGNYSSELTNYLSIQSEFPKVYGISDGGLDSSAATDRIARARQLQGYLLFFDQLLANYLTQLKNIRSLFAFSSPKQGGHTYFTNRLTNVPHFKELIRFRTEEGVIGNEGKILAYPTERKKLEQFIESGKIKFSGPKRKCKDGYQDDFPVYEFCHATERDQAVKQLQEDLKYDGISPVIVSNESECYFFYFFTSSSEFAMISKIYYKDEQEARNAAASVTYAALFEENYRNYISACSGSGTEMFSFDVELNLNTYDNYLQLIAEDSSLYGKRRQGFLDHLLARFAESFTDFAVISAPFLDDEKMMRSSISAKERFLTNYADISSNRGKAYDYMLDGWGNNNISGFEKRFKALTGIEQWERRYLCNFIVDKADEQYQLMITLFDEVFELKGKFPDKSAALASLKSLYSKLASAPDFQPKQATLTGQWHVVIYDEPGNEYTSRRIFNDEHHAQLFATQLHSSLVFKPGKQNIFPVGYVYRVFLKNLDGKEIAESREEFQSYETAAAYIGKISKNLSAHAGNAKEFDSRVGKNFPEKLVSFIGGGGQRYFVNESEFVFKHFDVFQLAEIKKKFTLLNKETTLQFDSLVIYDDVKQAREGFRSILSLLHVPDHYLVEEDLDDSVHRIYIVKDNEKKAVYFQNFEKAEVAWERVRALIAQITPHIYQLHISDPIPDTWEFSFEPSGPGQQKLFFQSRSQYKSSALAERAAESFYSNIGNMELKIQGDELVLLQRPGTKMQLFATITGEEQQKAAQKLWQSYQSTFNTIAGKSDEELLRLLLQYRINADEAYIYKLVDRNTTPARYFETEPFTTQQTAEYKKNELISLAASGYDFVNIALGGEPVRERKDTAGKVKWYHYQIKCTNRFYTKGELSGQPLVLFESVKGYTAREEAIKAFQENYGNILRWGRQEINYGKGKPISLEETFIYLDNLCMQDRSLVFVPRETSEEFNGYEVQKELVLFVRNYPLRFIRKNKIRFSLSRIVGTSVIEDWRSTRYYTNVKDALQALHFFLMLLKYPGNFFVDYDEILCSYHINLREVLAVSAHGFPTPEAAWGEQGIERFICIGQTRDGFHNYWNQLNCSYSFYLPCGNTGLIHPCSYETPGRRDMILERLWKASSFNFFDLVVDITAESILLMDANKNHLAWIHLDPEVGKFSVCEWLIIFIETLQHDENYGKSETGPFLKYKYKKEGDLHYRYYILAEWSTKEIIGLKEWKKRLLEIVCYFPVVKVSADKSPDKYYIDIKLPGFESCESYLGGDPCSPQRNDDPCTISCYTSWKSECCFNTSCEALEYYAYAYGMLRNRENYMAVFDCNCGSYRIELHPRLSTEGTKKLISDTINLLRVVRRYTKGKRSYDPRLYNTSSYRGNKESCFSEIIAINPQQYENEKMVCEAADRARKLINAEGLHLAEHILFRPRCKEKDQEHYVECGCEFQPRPYAHPDINCHFTWKPGGDVDPCEENETVCFTPGCDPYSFIATVVLPAWPERFRNDRELIEKILRRETPAHVMLRILWLRPRDLCCFEHYFKSWNEWLAKKLCDKSYSNCEFMAFLFRKEFTDLADCMDCMPCSETTQNTDCNKEEKGDECDHNINHIVDDLFHWGKGLPGYAYNGYGPCMQKVNEGSDEVMDVDVLVRVSEPEPLAAIEAPAISEIARHEKEKSAIIQRRTNRYRQNINSVTPDTPFADDAIIFLKNTRPEPGRYKKLVENIVGDKIGKGKKLKGRISDDKKVLIRNITWKYLDLVCFHKNQEKNMEALEHVFAFLGRKGIDMKAVYEEWDSKTITDLEPSADLEAIKHSLTLE